MLKVTESRSCRSHGKVQSGCIFKKSSPTIRHFYHSQKSLFFSTFFHVSSFYFNAVRDRPYNVVGIVCHTRVLKPYPSISVTLFMDDHSRMTVCKVFKVCTVVMLDADYKNELSLRFQSASICSEWYITFAPH